MKVHFKSKYETLRCIEVLAKVLRYGTANLTDSEVADLTTILVRLTEALEVSVSNTGVNIPKKGDQN